MAHLGNSVIGEVERRVRHKAKAARAGGIIALHDDSGIHDFAELREEPGGGSRLQRGRAHAVFGKDPTLELKRQEEVMEGAGGGRRGPEAGARMPGRGEE